MTRSHCFFSVFFFFVCLLRVGVQGVIGRATAVLSVKSDITHQCKKMAASDNHNLRYVNTSATLLSSASMMYNMCEWLYMIVSVLLILPLTVIEGYM